MYTDEQNFGITLISGNGFMLYKLTKSGSHIEATCLYDSSVRLQKKQKKGGQSAPRIERIRQEKEHNYVKKVSAKMIEYYMINNHTELTVSGILVGGPAQMKRKVVEYSETQKMLGNHILKIVDTPEISTSVVWDVYENCIDVISNTEDKEALHLIEEIRDMISIADQKLVFGMDEVIFGLENCMLKKVLISSELEKGMMDRIEKLNTYGCEIIRTNPLNYKSIGIDTIGIKWY